MGRKRWEDVAAEVEEQPHVQHPDRVTWYQGLIGEWTTQIPKAVVMGEMVAAWIGPYSSTVGIRHACPTQVWAATVEEALEQLCIWVYQDVQEDIAQMHAETVVVAGGVSMEEWEPWMVSGR